jgi:Mg2+/Co2+ transporter CorC
VKARIRERGVDTVGGYALKLFGRVPAEGDTVSDGQFTFLVRQMKRRRIVVLHVTRRREDGSGREGMQEDPEGRDGRPPGAFP